ncbi:MAG: CehA/McbA family metallohydrolase [Cyclobacteriaceae bacterium]|nr:CehA/McbA family metallohydrolase [Cyclobacteriaceae bacterium]
MIRPVFLIGALFYLLIFSVDAQRVPVLSQIDLPHNYYFRELFLPQLTSGPGSVAWSPDGKSLVFSMGGSLWKQNPESDLAEQLTDGNGYDYQPDWSPDGNQIIFVRYNGSSVELMVLDLSTNQTTSLTSNKAVNLEPRWSPDGKSVAFISTVNTNHFLLYTARIQQQKLGEFTCLTPDNKSSVDRYYYSTFDHAINPVWSREGKQIFFVSNKEIAHGTGDIVSIDLSSKEVKTIQHEETSWRTRPDLSPDGTRLVYSSYLGRNWHQLWLLPVSGGYPIPLTYGEHDNSSPRWSPDGKKIAFISNREGNTSMWTVNVFDGGQKQIIQRDLRYLSPGVPLQLKVQDENRNDIATRISITDSRGKFYAPTGAWIHADDSYYPNHQQYESHYFHREGIFEVMVPNGKINVEISHGPEYELLKLEVDAEMDVSQPMVITLKKLPLPSTFGKWQSGDLHVHMNYGGNYRTEPRQLIQQAEAENLNFVFNLIVNKEQRIPDINYFSPEPDKASTDKSIILHTQEFHTSFWGHLGLLNLSDHVILPGYTGYPQTAVESIFPHNSFIADRAHEQNALVGYVHPFEHSSIFPDQASNLFSELPVDAALGKVDYYELVGFADHIASAAVWYKLLNCGFQIPAGAGTDAMTNYASLRGPVGLNRVYIKNDGPLDPNKFLKDVAEGKSFVTNGPILGLTVDGKSAGDSLRISKKGQMLKYAAFLRSNFPVDHFEIIWNGDVIAKHTLPESKKTFDVEGSIKVKEKGWLLLRAWSDQANPDLMDLYPYASTNPIYINSDGENLNQKSAKEYFLKWVKRIEAKAVTLTYRTEEERKAVMDDIEKAKKFYENR